MDTLNILVKVIVTVVLAYGIWILTLLPFSGCEDAGYNVVYGKEGGSTGLCTIGVDYDFQIDSNGDYTGFSYNTRNSYLVISAAFSLVLAAYLVVKLSSSGHSKTANK